MKAPHSAGAARMLAVASAVGIPWLQVGATNPPEIDPVAPADGTTSDLPRSVRLAVDVADADSAALEVRFFGRPVGAATPVGEFTVVVVPDTQGYTLDDARNQDFIDEIRWICDERREGRRNIVAVIHVGDLVQNESADRKAPAPVEAMAEWARASAAMTQLEASVATGLPQGLPWSATVGNHDLCRWDDGTSAGFNTSFGIHPSTGLNHFHGRHYFGGTADPAALDDNYITFSAGGIDFLVVSLRYHGDANLGGNGTLAPPEAVLAWADGVLAAHPHHRAIVVTHHLMGIYNHPSDRTTWSAAGAAIYGRLRKHPNLVLMHGGHVWDEATAYSGEGRRSDPLDPPGEFPVHSLLANYQGRNDHTGDGWLRLMTFLPAEDKVLVRTCSAKDGSCEEDDDSRFDLTVDLSGGIGAFTELGSLAAPPGPAGLTWNEAHPALPLRPGMRYEWFASASDGTTTVTTPPGSFTTAGTLTHPTAVLATPPGGAESPPGQPILLAAAVADPDGRVAKVEFHAGATRLGEDTNEPFTWLWADPPAGTHHLFATATDNDGLAASSAPVPVTVTAGPPPLDPASASVGLFNPGWVVAATSPGARALTAPGTDTGDIAIHVAGTPAAFDAGAALATNWGDNPSLWSVRDNLCSPYQAGSGQLFVSVVDSDPDASGDPVVDEQSGGTAVAFLPWAGGWTGAGVAADGTLRGGASLPAGVVVARAGTGVYTVSGLPEGGNLLAFPNGDFGGPGGGDNIASVRTSGGQWVVDVRDNSSAPEDGEFTFVYLPHATPGVYSGTLGADGVVTALNAQLSALGATGSVTGDLLLLTLGDGAQVNPSNSALFLCGDSTDGGAASAAADNLVSYSAQGAGGVGFGIYTTDSPLQTSGKFEPIDLRFVAIPLCAVGVHATDAHAGEWGDDQALEFTFTRTGQPAGPLVVAYATGGSAVPGADFGAPAGTVVIPDGGWSATVAVQAAADGEIEGPESLTIEVAPGAGYVVGTPASATATLADRPLHDYLHAHGCTAAEDDDDGDGAPNLIEYYHGSAADDPASCARVLAHGSAGGGSLRVRFAHAKAAGDVAAAIRWSLDLAGWHASGEFDGPVRVDASCARVSPPADDPETLECLLTTVAGPTPRVLFARLRVAP